MVQVRRGLALWSHPSSQQNPQGSTGKTACWQAEPAPVSYVWRQWYGTVLACTLWSHLRVQHLAVQVRILPAQESAHPPGVDVFDHQHSVKGHPCGRAVALQRRACGGRGRKAKGAEVASLGAAAKRQRCAGGLLVASRLQARTLQQLTAAHLPPPICQFLAPGGTGPVPLRRRPQPPTPPHPTPSYPSPRGRLATGCSPICFTIWSTSCCHMIGGRSRLGPTPSAVARLARTCGTRQGGYGSAAVKRTREPSRAGTANQVQSWSRTPGHTSWELRRFDGGGVCLTALRRAVQETAQASNPRPRSGMPPWDAPTPSCVRASGAAA